MARKFLLVFAFLAAFSVLVSGFAFAEKSAVPKSELLKPIDSTPEDYVSQYLLKPSTGYVPSLFRPTADAIVGTTWYDQQANSSMPKMIANDYQPGGQHFTWMRWPKEPPANRYVDYRYNKTDGNFNPGVQVDGGPWNAGYCGLDIFLNSYEAVIFHTTAHQYPDPTETVRRVKIALEKGLSPGAGTFWIYDIPESTETMETAGMWPHGAIDSCSNIHVMSLEGATYAGPGPIGYIRCTPDGDLLRCEGPGVGPYYITPDDFCEPGSLVSYLDYVASISYIVAADPNSKKVALVWTKWTESYPVPDDSSQYQTAQDVWYLESENCGDDWIHADTFGAFTFTNITRWAPDDPYRTYADIAGVYDLEHNLHVFWNAHYKQESTDTYDPYDVKLMHWSENIEQVCPGSDTVRYTVVATRKSEPGNVGIWARNRLISKMSVGIGIPGSEKQGWLFCVWQQFDDDDISASGQSNGELYFSFSTNLGVSWAESRNLTNTPDSGCAAGECESEAWPSLATRVDTFMHIQYILDRDAGIVVQDEGTYTENYVMYKKERVDTLTAPAVARVDWTPKEFRFTFFPSDLYVVVDTLIIRNIGTAALAGNLSETADWLSISPTSFSLPEGSCPEIIEVTIDASAYAETLLVDSIRIVSNDQVGNDEVYILVKVGLCGEPGKPWLEPVNIGPPLNTAAGEFAPRLSQDMLTMLFVSRDRPGGYGLNDIWMASRDSIGAPWNEPANLGPPINTQYHDLFPCLSPDRLTLYFDSDKPGGYGDEDIYVSIRDSIGAPWNEPVNLGSPINTAWCDCQPVFGPDLLTLYFCSDRPGGYGGGDIWRTTRVSIDAQWNEPVNLGPPINTYLGEWNPSISSDGLTLYFDSEDRPGYGTAYGEADIWVATRDSIGAPWGKPINLGPPINTEYGAYTPWICYDGTILYFHSGLPGGYGGGDLWMSTKVQCGEINGDDDINLGDVIYLVKYIFGMGPPPVSEWASDVNCDSMINLADVIHLAKYLFGYPGFELNCCD